MEQDGEKPKEGGNYDRPQLEDMLEKVQQQQLLLDAGGCSVLIHLENIDVYDGFDQHWRKNLVEFLNYNTGMGHTGHLTESYVEWSQG